MSIQSYSDTKFEQFLKEAPLLFTWEEVLSSYNITNYTDMGGRLQLKCPFHDDKRPSFYADTNKRIFNCFSCKRHGSIIKFIHSYSGSNLSYKEYCERLLASNPVLQAKLGFKSLRVDTFNQSNSEYFRPKFSKPTLNSKTTLHTLSSHVKSTLSNSDNFWEGVVFTTSLLQGGVDLDSIKSSFDKVFKPTSKAKVVSVMDIIK